MAAADRLRPERGRRPRPSCSGERLHHAAEQPGLRLPTTTSTTCSCCRSSGRKRWTVHEPVHAASARRRSRGPTTVTQIAERVTGEPSSTPCSPPATRSICRAAGCIPRRRWDDLDPSDHRGVDHSPAWTSSAPSSTNSRTSTSSGSRCPWASTRPTERDGGDGDQDRRGADRDDARPRSELGEDAATRLAQRYAHRTRPVAVRPLASLEAAERAATVRCGGATAGRHDSTSRRACSPAPARPHDRAFRGRARTRCRTAPRPRRRCRPLPGLDTADGEVLIRRLLREAVVVPRTETYRRLSANDRCPDRRRAATSRWTRDEPMYGTASAGFSWLMLELSGRWGPSAFLQSPTIIDPAARARDRASRRGRGHADRGDPPARPSFGGTAVAMVRRALDVGAEALYHGEVSDPREYLDIALDGSDGQPSAGPTRRGLRPRQARSVLRGARPRRGGRDRRRVSRIALGNVRIWAATGSPRRCSSCPRGCATDASTRPMRPDLVRLYLDGRLDDRFLRGPHVASARRAGRTAFRARGSRRRPHRCPCPRCRPKPSRRDSRCAPG